MSPRTVLANMKIEPTDTPEAVVDEAVLSSCFLMMTYNHALDQFLCEAVLKRSDACWLGLIGSETKRIVRTSLVRGSIAQERLEDMVCSLRLCMRISTHIDRTGYACT